MGKKILILRGESSGKIGINGENSREKFGKFSMPCGKLNKLMSASRTCKVLSATIFIIKVKYDLFKNGSSISLIPHLRKYYFKRSLNHFHTQLDLSSFSDVSFL